MAQDYRMQQGPEQLQRQLLDGHKDCSYPGNQELYCCSVGMCNPHHQLVLETSYFSTLLYLVNS